MSVKLDILTDVFSNNISTSFCLQLVSISGRKSIIGQGHLLHGMDSHDNSFMCDLETSKAGTKLSDAKSDNKICIQAYFTTCKPSIYRKFPKYSNTQIICWDYPSSWTRWLFLRLMHPKDYSWSSLIWVCTVCPGLSVRELMKITVLNTKQLFI